MEEEKRVCIVCGNDISHLRIVAKYCSLSCQGKFLRKKSPEKKRASQRKYYKNNKVKCIQAGKVYAQSHPEVTHRKNLKFYKAHRKECIQAAALWHKANYRKSPAARDYHSKHSVKRNEDIKIYRLNAKLTLSNSYVKRLLTVSMFPGVEITQEMIVSKRELILLSQKIKQSKL
jgi:hypothetical protein